MKRKVFYEVRRFQKLRSPFGRGFHKVALKRGRIRAENRIGKGKERRNRRVITKSKREKENRNLLLRPDL